MYSKSERPIVRGTIFYYDDIYDDRLARDVISILENFSFFPPEKVYADKLTRGKFVNYSPDLKPLIIEAYSQKGVFGLDMASGNSKTHNDYWRVSWEFTFYKNEKLSLKPQFKPWNVFSLDLARDRLQNHNLCQRYLSCIIELIRVINPFYAKVDDVSNAVHLLEQAHEPYFKPDYIQQIFWGNYFGKDYCFHYGKERLMDIVTPCVKVINDGVFFSLTPNIIDFQSKECEKKRKTIKSLLQI